MTPQSIIIIDVDGRGRTGWTQGEADAPGRFVGVDAVEAAAAAATGTSATIRYEATAPASDLTAVGAIAAIIATADGASWHLVAAPRELLELINS